MNKLFNFLMVAIFVTALALSAIGTAPVAAQSNTNLTDWESEAFLADFAAAKRNAIYEPSNPIPVEAPEEVLEALERGAYLVVIEPWKAGCGDNPVQNPNCNVGFVRSFTDWTKMRNFLYGALSEGNPGHFGPWTNGSIKISYIREMTADEMDISDWVQYVQGKIRVNFAENKPLPIADPTNGLVLHALSEPWRHGCDGNSENPNCQVGKSAIGTWVEILAKLKEGKWTRGSIVAWPKEASATAVPSNTPVAPAAGSVTPATPAAGTATAQPTNTAVPESTIEITVYTVTPDAVGGAEPTDAEAAMPVAETPREGGGGFWLWCCGSLFVIAALLIWANWRKIRRWMDRNGIYPYDETPAEQPVDEGAGGGEQPADEDAGADVLLAHAEEPAADIPSWMHPADETPGQELGARTPRTRRHQG